MQTSSPAAAAFWHDDLSVHTVASSAPAASSGMHAPQHHQQSARLVKVKVDIVRMRRIVGLIGFVDAVLVLFLFLFLFSASTFASIVEWFDLQVLGFQFNNSLFDLLCLSFLRFVLLTLYAIDFGYFGLFAWALLPCLLSIPYIVVKALFIHFATASGLRQAILMFSLIVAFIESILLVYGMMLHLRKHYSKTAKFSSSSKQKRTMQTFSLNADDEHTPLLHNSALKSAYANVAPALDIPYNRRERSISFATANELTFATPTESPVEGNGFHQDNDHHKDDDEHGPKLRFENVDAKAALSELEKNNTCPMHKLILRGVYLSWDNQFADAHAELEKFAPFSPRSLLHVAEINLVKQAITGRLSERDKLLASLDKVDAVVAQVLANEKNLESYAHKMQDALGKYEADHREGINWPTIMSPSALAKNYKWDVEIVAADSTLWRSLFQIGGGQELRGAYNLRRAWKMYDALQTEMNAERAKSPSSSLSISIHPGVEDALKFGVGLFYFLVSMVPGQFLFILEAMGFKANRDLGIQLLRDVQRNGGIRAPIASLVLLMNYLFIPRALSDVKELLGNAEPIIRECIGKMPNGTLYLLMASHYVRKTGQVDDAIPYLNKAISNCGQIGLQPNNYLFELALCYYMKLDWVAAARIFEGLLMDETNHFEMKPLAAMQLASCYIAVGREEEAFAQIGRVPSLIVNNSNRFAKIAKAKAERIYKRHKAPFLAFDFLYLRRDMAHQGTENLQRSLKILENLEPVTQGDVESRAQFVLLYGANLKFLNRLDEALTVLSEIKQIEKQVKEERYTIPFCYYEIGEIMYNQKRVADAEHYFSLVKNFSGTYDFSDILRNRIRLCFERIDKEKKSAV